MKNTLLVAAALTALSFSAFAADLPARTFAPVASAPIFSWTGFYVGGSVGSLTASFKQDNSLTDTSFAPTYLYAISNKSSVASTTVGAAVGYNHQFGNIVAGLEADYNFANAQNYTMWDGGTTTLGSFGTFRGRLG